MKRVGISVFVCALTSWAFSQTGVTGSASISLVDAGNICSGAGKVVHVVAEVSGLTGLNGESVGLNSFVIQIELSRPTVLAWAFAGENPDLGWGFMQTDKLLIPITNTVIVAGWVADAEAPNQLYHLASLWMAGDAGPVELTVVSATLGSRVVNGDGPGSVPTLLPVPMSVTLPAAYTWTLIEGLVSWRAESGFYDVRPPAGVNVLDFVDVVNCGG